MHPDRNRVYDAPLNKHQQRTQVTKARLLDAAYHVFTRDGFEAARIEDIAADAGYTRGAFYAHFKTKEDLFFALLEQKAAAHIEELRAALEVCRDDDEKLARLREFYVSKSAQREWSILVLEFKLYALRRRRKRARLAEVHRRIRGAVQVRIQASIAAPLKTTEDVPDASRAALESALTALVLERAYDPKRVSEAQARELLGQIFDALVCPAPTAAPDARGGAAKLPNSHNSKPRP